MPFVGLHVAAVVLPFFAAPTWAAIGWGAVFYLVRMFGVTAAYHRYFSHRSYKTSRWFQFVLAWIGCSAMQKGPLWWAAHHRHHHKHSDQEDDPHSPIVRSVWWAHMGWVLSGRFRQAPPLQDFEKFPELRWLDRYFTWLPGLSLALLCYWLAGWSGVVYGFIVGTVLLYHATFLVNSACHLFGTRRYDTPDQSRNCWWAALLTMGEGWHNNHHHYQSCARQGFYWWEIDLSYYILRALAWTGLIWDIREPTAKALSAGRIEPQS